jgi:hypothetical protein
MQAPTLLHQPISELGLSETFNRIAIRHGFRNLQDILNWPVSVLLEHDGFTYHIYQELQEFLKKNELQDLLKTD